MIKFDILKQFIFVKSFEWATYKEIYPEIHKWTVNSIFLYK